MEREWRKIIKNESVPYFLVGEAMERKKDFNNLIKDLRIDYRVEHLKGVIVEDDWQVDEAKQIICEKFNLAQFPKEIEIKVNTIRYVPDEG